MRCCKLWALGELLQRGGLRCEHDSQRGPLHFRDFPFCACSVTANRFAIVGLQKHIKVGLSVIVSGHAVKDSAALRGKEQRKPPGA